MTNILTSDQEHWLRCQEKSAVNADPGDVVRCRHGQVMEAMTAAGMAVCLWVTLPRWSRRWFRARRALRRAGEWETR